MTEQRFHLFYLMRANNQGALAFAGIGEQRIIKLLAVENIQTQGRLIKNKQLHIDSQDHR